MSWSIMAGGKTDAVRATLKTQFEKIQYLQGPEAAIKDKAAELVDLTLSGFEGATGVSVNCSGSESKNTKFNEETKQHEVVSANQTVQIEIRPIWGWTE